MNNLLIKFDIAFLTGPDPGLSGARLQLRRLPRARPQGRLHGARRLRHGPGLRRRHRQRQILNNVVDVAWMKVLCYLLNVECNRDIKESKTRCNVSPSFSIDSIMIIPAV